MTIELVRFLAMIVGPSITAAARPGLTFFAIQLTSAALVFYGYASLPSSIAWLVSPGALIVAGVFAALEVAARNDPDFEALLRDLQLDKLGGAFGAFSAALLFTTLGLPESEASTLIEATDSDGIIAATAAAATSSASTPLQVGAVAGGLAANFGLTWLRAQLLEFIDEFELAGLWARIETGGVIGVLVLLPLLPLVAVTFIVLSALALAAVSMMARAARRYADRRARIACPSCDHAIRPEASLCPSCRTEVTPTALRTPERSIADALDALRQRNPAS